MNTVPAFGLGLGNPHGFLSGFGFGRNRLTRELMKFAVQVFRQVVRDVER